MNNPLAWPSTHISLLTRLREPSDQEAWLRFVDLYAALVYQFGIRRGLQDADAQDVTQEVCLTVSRAMNRFDYQPERGRFRDWLGVITLRAIERQRRKVTCGQGRGGDESGALRHEPDAKGRSEWVAEFSSHLFRNALQRIRPVFAEKVWRAFELVWLENVSPAEAARLLEQKPQWVYKAKFQVLLRLREEVQALLSDEGLFALE
jgi:RNA polymerase sigma-70 factor (ECF subfamily)